MRGWLWTGVLPRLRHAPGACLGARPGARRSHRPAAGEAVPARPARGVRHRRAWSAVGVRAREADACAGLARSPVPSGRARRCARHLWRCRPRTPSRGGRTRRPAAAGRRDLALGLGAWALAPFVLALTVSFVTPIYLDRYLITAAPAFALLAGVAVLGVGRRFGIILGNGCGRDELGPRRLVFPGRSRKLAWRGLEGRRRHCARATLRERRGHGRPVVGESRGDVLRRLGTGIRPPIPSGFSSGPRTAWTGRIRTATARLRRPPARRKTAVRPARERATLEADP